MKKYCLFLFLIFSAVLTFAAPDPYAHLEFYNIVNKKFFEKIISGKEANYMICFTEEDVDKYIDKETANKIFLDSVNNWIDKIQYYISKNNAESEFDDVLKMLDNVTLNEVSCSEYETYYELYEEDILNTNKADLILKFTNNIRNKMQLGNFNTEKSTMLINVSEKYTLAKYVYILSHELGHAFGLADQYSGQTYKGSFIYNSKVKRPSIMDKSKKITCDDVDGFITSMDRTLAKEREFYSLCHDGVFIKNGQAVTKNNKTYKFKENYDFFNAKIEASYDTGLPDSYIVDMTLKNFILAPYGLDFVKDMGFEIEDLNTLKNVQIKIHGMITESPDRTDFDKQFKTPVGLWTFVLYLKQGTELEPKQIITRNYHDDDDYIVFTDLDKNSSYVVDKDLIVPMINLLPNKGYFLKEILRVKFFFRGNPVKKKEVATRRTTSRGVSASAEIEKNLQKTLDNWNKPSNL